MRKIVSVNGFQLCEDGPRLVFKRSGHFAGHGPISLGAVILSAGVMYGAELAVFTHPSEWGAAWKSAIMFGAMILAGLTTLIVGVLRARRQPLGGLGLAVIDRASGWILDGSLAPVCPISQARVRYVGAHLSHIQTLAVTHPGGSLMIAQGTFWSPSIAKFAAALHACGVPISAW